VIELRPSDLIVVSYNGGCHWKHADLYKATRAWFVRYNQDLNCWTIKKVKDRKGKPWKKEIRFTKTMFDIDFLLTHNDEMLRDIGLGLLNSKDNCLKERVK